MRSGCTPDCWSDEVDPFIKKSGFYDLDYDYYDYDDPDENTANSERYRTLVMNPCGCKDDEFCADPWQDLSDYSDNFGYYYSPSGNGSSSDGSGRRMRRSEDSICVPCANVTVAEGPDTTAKLCSNTSIFNPEISAAGQTDCVRKCVELTDRGCTASHLGITWGDGGKVAQGDYRYATLHIAGEGKQYFSKVGVADEFTKPVVLAENFGGCGESGPNTPQYAGKVVLMDGTTPDTASADCTIARKINQLLAAEAFAVLVIVANDTVITWADHVNGVVLGTADSLSSTLGSGSGSGASSTNGLEQAKKDPGLPNNATVLYLGLGVGWKLKSAIDAAATDGRSLDVSIGCDMQRRNSDGLPRCAAGQSQYGDTCSNGQCHAWLREATDDKLDRLIYFLRLLIIYGALL